MLFEYLSQMRKIHIVVLIVGAVIIGGYIWLRVALNKDRPPPNSVRAEVPIKEEPKAVLDVRPRIIERLQELVKKGSGGLYNLSIEEIEPDVLESTVQVLKLKMTPDEAGLAELVKSRQAPDDIFELSAPSLHIAGIGLDDLLKKDVIDLKLILINDPVITVRKQKRSYNKSDSDSSSVYQKLLGQLKSLSVAEIQIKNGTLILHNSQIKKSNTVFKCIYSYERPAHGFDYSVQ